jgi:hypothetical protein
VEKESLRFYEEQIKEYMQLRSLYTQYADLLKVLLHNPGKGCSTEYILIGII